MDGICIKTQVDHQRQKDEVEPEGGVEVPEEGPTGRSCRCHMGGNSTRRVLSIPLCVRLCMSVCVLVRTVVPSVSCSSVCVVYSPEEGR